MGKAVGIANLNFNDLNLELVRQCTFPRCWITEMWIYLTLLNRDINKQFNFFQN